MCLKSVGVFCLFVFVGVFFHMFFILCASGDQKACVNERAAVAERDGLGGRVHSGRLSVWRRRQCHTRRTHGHSEAH